MLEKQISIRIDSETHKKIEVVAKDNKRKFSDMARLILEENIKKMGGIMMTAALKFTPGSWKAPAMARPDWLKQLWCITQTAR
jgi:hypothetical protein